MEQINVHYETKHEVVWEMSPYTKKLKADSQKPVSKQPTPVKALIEKTFKLLSAQLLNRMNHLEEELRNLQAENAELKNKLAEVRP
ncbi:MAG: hypothetical protein HC880_00105 [Bacteroidia bacterium]|nr:hypothetical protein [Bacteroidia bacterium]